MPKIIIASGPVIVKDNKVLLNVSGQDSFWKFCGGKVKENEAPTETAVREALEELNIDIEIIDPIPFELNIKQEKNDELIDIKLFHFLAKYSGKIKSGPDVIKWDWIPFEKLESENLAPNIIPTLKHFGFIK